MPLHVVVDRDWLDLLLGIGALLLSLVAVGIALWTQSSVGKERRRATEIETAWRVFETFRSGPYASAEAQRSVLKGLLATLTPEDFPLLRGWVEQPDERTPEGNRVLEDAAAAEYADVVARRL